MNKLVELIDVDKTYDGENYVLKNLNFTIKKGEIVTIFGKSGCGKSTFLNIIGLIT